MSIGAKIWKQETFVRLFQKRKDYQATARFSTFLWRIALNHLLDELRRQNRRREVLTAATKTSIRWRFAKWRRMCPLRMRGGGLEEANWFERRYATSE